jgi:hypothetical protein
MKEIHFHQVKIDFYCDRCGKKQKGVDIQECIYNGPPLCMCTEDGEETLPDKIYLDQ